MPNLKDYPKGFSPYSYNSGVKPTKPQEFINKYITLGEISLGGYETIGIEEIPQGTEKISLEVEDGYDGSHEIKIEFIKIEKAPNVKYDQELERYNELMKNFKVQEKEWKNLKKQWDVEEKQEQKESRKRQFDILKKEFDNVEQKATD